MILTAICSASDGKDENCQSSCLREYWLQLTLKEKLRIPVWENILYSGLLCVFHPDSDLGHSFNGPPNCSGSQFTFVYTSSTGPFQLGLLKAGIQLFKTSLQLSQTCKWMEYAMWSSASHPCPLEMTLQMWKPTEIILKDAITTREASQELLCT